MSRLRAVLGSLFGPLIGLVVDDGFLAVGALVVIAAIAVAADERLLGTGDGTGWALVALLAVTTTVSVMRAVRAAAGEHAEH
ncbi:MAG: hypothetical protein AAGA93_08915 [Actinomycetota bacterium]